MMTINKVCRIAILASCLVLMNSGIAFSNTADGWLAKVDYKVSEPDEFAEIRQQIVDDIDTAKTRIDAALFHFEDEAIAQALVRAHKRGVEVRLVGDEDNRGGAGFAIAEQNDIAVAFGDGELVYLPDPTLSPLLEECQNRDDYRICTQAGNGYPGSETDNLMVRPGSYNMMSHNFILIDAITIWNLATPLSGEQAQWVGWRMQNEKLLQSFEREFQQMFGGVFSTTLSVYNGPLKSLTQNSPIYQTDKGLMRVLFNPQERLVKTVIDEIYRSRASVFVMTEDISNPWLLDALEYKQQNGFDVRIIVGANQSPTMQSRVMALGAKQLPQGSASIPTMILIDTELDRFNKTQPRLVQVLSHPLLRAAPFEVEMAEGADRVMIFPSDLFVDGSLWELLERGSRRNAEIDQFLNVWKSIWDGVQ